MRNFFGVALAVVLLIVAGGGSDADAAHNTWPTEIDALAWSPDGRWLSYGVRNYDDTTKSGYYVVRRDGAVQRRVISLNPAFVSWLPEWSGDSRRVAFSTGETTWVSLADGRGLRRFEGSLGNWSPKGTEFVLSRGRPRSIYAIEPRTGETRRLATGSFPMWSPDGDRIAFEAITRRSCCYAEIRVFSVNPDGGDLRQLSPDDKPYWLHLLTGWSPDSTRISYMEYPDGGSSPEGTFVAPADGSRQATLIGNGYPTWSPDGSRISLQDYVGRSLTLVSPAGRHLRTINGVVEFSWSAKGRRIAYATQRSGAEASITVTWADGSGSRWLGPGEHPAFSSLGWIAFSRSELCGVSVYVIRPDGTHGRRLTFCSS